MRRLARSLLLLAVLLLSPASGAQAPGTTLLMQPRQVDLSEPADLKRDEVIAELQGIIPRVDGSRQLELQFRLAETYWEKSRFAYSKEYQRFDNAYQAWVDGGRKGPEPDLSKYTERTKNFRDLALKEYQRVLDSKTEYDRVDEVLFMLAYNQMESGEKTQARQNLAQLVKRFPDSRFAADAQLAIGEDAFNSNDLPRAEAAYKKAYALGLKNEKSSTYVYALYKLAWCDFNRRNFQASLDKFQEVVRLSEEGAQRQADGSSGKKETLQLLKEALSDVVKSYAQVGNVEAALSYFKDKAPKGELYNLTLRLARAFNEQGDSLKEIETYERLIELNPQDSSIASHLASMFAARAALNQYDKIGETAKKIADECRGKQQAKPCEDGEAKIREVVTNFHKFAQSDRYQKDYRVARELYEIYLPAFPNSTDHHRLAFYYADLLWDIGELQNAAVAYEAVVAFDHKGENALTAAMNAVMAYEKVVRNEPVPRFIEGRLSLIKNEKKTVTVKQLKAGESRGKQEANFTAQPLSETETSLVKACDQYVALVQELGKAASLEEDVMNTRYKAAYIYQAHFQFDEANARFNQIIKTWPKSKMARDAVVLMLDGYDARKDWAKLELHANEFAANKTLMEDKALAATTQKFLEGAAFNTIASKEAAAKPEEKMALASSYEQFVQKHPKSSFAVSSLFNALLIYRDTNRNESTVRVGQKLLTDYKDHISQPDMEEKAIAPTAMIAVAKAKENSFAFADAARIYDQFATRYKGKPESEDMLYNAGILQLRAGNLGDALSLLERHLKLYSSAKDSPKIVFLIAGIHEQRNDSLKAKAAYNRYLSLKTALDPAQQMQARFAIAKMDNKTCQSLIKAYDALSAEQKQLSDARKGRAYCGFVLLEPQRQAFAKITMKVPAQNLRKQIGQKKIAMEELAQAYLNILSFGDDEWGIAALYEAARSQIAYVNALREVQDPQGLDAEALTIFRQELENIVAPVESDAVQALEKALAKAFELKVYTTYTKDLSQTLSQFYPSPLRPFVWDFSTIKEGPKSSTDQFGSLAITAFAADNENLSRWAAQQAIAESHNAGAMYELLGQWELRRGRIANAVAAFAKGCDAVPASLNACANVGAIALDFKDFNRASDAYQKAKDMDPKNALWSMAHGYALAALGQSELAIAELSKILTQTTSAKEAYACMCIIYRNQKSDAQTAMEWCNKYRMKNSGMLTDSDPMKSVITGLEAELKASKPSSESISNNPAQGGG